jgi:hypothetical protein
VPPQADWPWPKKEVKKNYPTDIIPKNWTGNPVPTPERNRDPAKTLSTFFLAFSYSFFVVFSAG